jgi:hypothetical protein
MFRALLLSAAAVVAATFLALGGGGRAAEAEPTITVTQGCFKDLYAPFDGMMDCFASHPFGVKHVQLVLPSDGPFAVALHGQYYDCEPVVYFSVPDVGDPNLSLYIETTPCLPNGPIDDYKSPDVQRLESFVQLQLVLMKSRQ